MTGLAKKTLSLSGIRLSGSQAPCRIVNIAGGGSQREVIREIPGYGPTAEDWIIARPCCL